MKGSNRMPGVQEARDRDLVREAVRLRGASPEKLVKALDDLNGYIIGSVTIGIKSRKPSITDRGLSRELRRAFA